MTDVLELPFDQYQRYRLTADLLEELRGSAPKLSVLDVGGRTALLRGFLPKDDVHLVDVESSSERGLVLGSGAALPYKDASFDAVAAFDTLEHVPPPLRQAFVAECARVAKKWVLLAGPYEAPRVVEAEELLQRFLREKLKSEHRYLNEHRHNGLPVRAAIEKQLAASGARVQSFGHANLERWLFGMCLSMYLDDDPSLRAMAKSFHRFYNRELYRSDHAEPVYRHVIVAALRGAPLPTGAGLLDSPNAPRGALAPFARLSEELVAFDRERSAWRTERETLREIARVLEKDLEGHRSSLASALHALDDQSRVIHDLENDLAGHRQGWSDTRAELDAFKAEHVRLIAAEREVQAELSRELDAHRHVLAELNAELERYVAVRRELEKDLDAHRAALAFHEAALVEVRAEVERRGEVQAHLEREVARVEGVAQGLQNDLIASNENARRIGAELAHTRAELDASRAENAALRAELRSRWKNLKRGVSPKKPNF